MLHERLEDERSYRVQYATSPSRHPNVEYLGVVHVEVLHGAEGDWPLQKQPFLR